MRTVKVHVNYNAATLVAFHQRIGSVSKHSLARITLINQQVQHRAYLSAKTHTQSTIVEGNLTRALSRIGASNLKDAGAPDRYTTVQ